MKTFLDRLFTVMGMIQLVVAIILGLAGAYVLGSVFGMGAKGYSIGFILGFALGFGAISFE